MFWIILVILLIKWDNEFWLVAYISNKIIILWMLTMSPVLNILLTRFSFASRTFFYYCFPFIFNYIFGPPYLRYKFSFFLFFCKKVKILLPIFLIFDRYTKINRKQKKKQNLNKTQFSLNRSMTQHTKTTIQKHYQFGTYRLPQKTEPN